MKSFLQKLFKPTSTPAIIVVSGLPRSGTSMMMKMLEAGGIPPLTDQIRAADGDNPKGYYEFERVKKLDKGDTAWLPDAQDKTVKVISALLKHLPGDYNYRVIFMRRNIEEILASQKKMLINRGEPTDKVSDEELTQMFDKHLKTVMDWMAAQPNVDVIYVSYNEILQDPTEPAQKINQFLGNTLNVEKMVSIVDPKLHRQKHN
jgi:hypothetical protein